MNQRITSSVLLARHSNSRSRQWLLVAATTLALSICFANLYQITVSIPSDDYYWRSNNDQPSASYDPYVNRWQARLSSKGGHLFFKHMRKAGGTLLRNFLHAFMQFHGHGTFQQFLQRTDQKEVMRHFPFFDSEQMESAESYFNQTINRSKNHSTMPNNKVFFIEQEFSTMDWQCRNIDPRWNDSLSVIILRHPIERHLSEFFYSGPPATSEFDGVKYSPRKYKRRLQINRTKLYTNKTYTDMLSKFLQEHLQAWTRDIGEIPFHFKWYFRPRYIDNFQLRALSGCASGECLITKNVSDTQRSQIHQGYPIANEATKPIDSVCTMHPFYRDELKDICISKKDINVCHECDGPCFYPAAAWGNVTRDDLSHAIHSLEGFDMVFITETISHKDQLSLLADGMGAPRNISITTELGNINIAKQSSREKTHYYRDLISNLTHPHLMISLYDENKLEIELYHHAVRLNRLMLERWKREVKWKDEEANEYKT